MAIGIIFVWYGLLKAEKLLFLTTCQYFQERNFLREKRFLVCNSCHAIDVFVGPQGAQNHNSILEAKL